MHRLLVKNVTYFRESQLVLKDFSLQAHAGDVILIRGENGSGKTTLLRLLGGILSPTTGTITYSPEVSKVYLGHTNGLKSYWTVRAYLRSLADTYESFLKAINLTHVSNDLIQSLSAGMKRRLAFAPAVLSNASIWLLDEPFTHMDPSARTAIESLISTHVSAGGIVVLTGHTDLDLPHKEVWLHA